MSQDSRDNEWRPEDFTTEAPRPAEGSPGEGGSGLDSLAPYPADPLGMFGGEGEQPSSSPSPSPKRRMGWKPVLVAIGLIALAAIAMATGLIPSSASIASIFHRSTPDSAPQEGRLVVESQPRGAQVMVDGVAKGTTPIALKLAAGRHVLRVGATNTREITVDVTAGAEVVHHIELPVVTTRLRVESVPTGAPVSVDGQARGMAPLDLTDLSAGSHAVLVGYGAAAVHRQVEVQPGLENSILVTLGPAAGTPTVGWLTVTAPVDLDIYEGSRLVGRSRDERLLLMPGAHDLTLVNRDLGVNEARRVDVAAGQTARLRVQPANGVLNVNAVPWAEVFLDGTRIGETPIANFSTPVGTHELVLRHPDLGEQRRTVIVGLLAPARVGVSFRQ